jgi:16S rRNA processing protein RimM
MSDTAPATEWVTVAVLGRARGIRGEVTAIGFSTHAERYAQLKKVYLFGAGEAHVVEEVWDHGGTLIFKFQGIDSMNQAELLRGFEVRVPKAERVQLEPGEFFLADLVGCEMRDRVSGRLYGKVTGWVEGGGPLLLEVNDGRMLVPFVKAICTEIQPEAGVIRVDLPVGLEDLSRDA